MCESPTPTPNPLERILDSSYELFSQHGVRAVGVDAIVAHAGVAKMTLYRYFASKDELVLAFMERREKPSGSLTPASSARCLRKARMLKRCLTAA